MLHHVLILEIRYRAQNHVISFIYLNENKDPIAFTWKNLSYFGSDDAIQLLSDSTYDMTFRFRFFKIQTNVYSSG